MKTNILYVTSFILVFFSSCSVEEGIKDSSEQEKELKVKSLIKTFAEDVIPSSGFSEFMLDVQNKSSSGLTQEEIDGLEQDFLSQQSAEFVELYYYVVSLNLSEDEIRIVIIEYLSNVNKGNVYNSNKDSEECVAAGNQDTGSLWGTILSILCEMIQRGID
ncbi:hypothetical protein ACWGOQ_0010330 [Aquimarina sp. M1]